MAKDETSLWGVAEETAGKPSYLRRKPTQGKGLV